MRVASDTSYGTAEGAPMSTARVANARMYSTTAETREDWKTLLSWVLARAELPWQVIDYDPPAPLDTLWARPDLGLAMMCGLPFARRTPQPILIAAPVPSPARYGHRPVYFTDIVVRADSPYMSLEHTFGGIVGYTLTSSMSGGVALRHHLSTLRAASDRQRLYHGAVGQLIHARGVIEALADGRIDVGPLDSYYHDLLIHGEPDFAAQVRVVATTRAMPIPPWVSTAALRPDEVERLRDALLAVSSMEELLPLRERLLLAGFTVPRPSDYGVLAEIAQRPMPTFEEL